MTTEDWGQYYEETNVEKAHHDWEEDKKRSERIRSQRPVDGEHLYRFLPKRKGAKHEHFYRVIYVHYLRHPSDEDNLLLVALCPAKMLGPGHECGLCAGASKLRKAGWEWKQVKDAGLSPQRKVLAGAVRLKNDGSPLEGDPGKPFVMDIPYAVEELIMPLLAKGSTRFYGDISHPFTGVNVSIERKGKGREGTEYNAMPFLKPVPLANLEWLKDLPDLDNIEEMVGVDTARAMLAQHYPVTGYLPPSGAGASADKAQDEEDEYELVADPDKPGEMISRKELMERQAR